MATGLYYSGLMRRASQLARTHELQVVSGSRLLRLPKSSSSKFCVLCYHRVGTKGVPLFSRLEPRVFEAQMAYLRKNYRVVALSQLCRELREGQSVEPTVAITFDDGYRDLYAHAFPILQRYQIPATVYLIGRCVETGELPWYDQIFLGLSAAPEGVVEFDLDGSRCFELSSPQSRADAAWQAVCYLRTIPDSRRREWCARFARNFPLPPSGAADKMLNWEHVRKMHGAGIDFGAHTMTHPVVSQLPLGALTEELDHVKQLLEAGLQAEVENFAYPFGKESDICNSAADEVLLRAGYRSAATTMDGCNRHGMNVYRLHRMQIGDSSSIPSFAFDLARMFLAAHCPSGPAVYNGIEAGEGQASVAGRGL